MSTDLTQRGQTAKAAGPVVATPAELDEALIREIAKGNQLAMRTLFLRHQVRVYRFILRMVRDRGMAEDVLSEAFLDVWRRADRFEGRSAASTWILSIARHKALTALRRQPIGALDGGDALLDVADPARDPEAEMRKNENETILRRCLNALSAEHGEMIDLVYYQQKSINEIAEILGIPVNTVKTRMFYARKRLGMLLEAAGLDHSRV